MLTFCEAEAKEPSQQKFLFSKTPWRRLEDNFSETIENLSRLLQDVFARRLPRLLKDVFKTCFQDFFLKTSSRCLEDFFKKTSRKQVSKTTWRRLQYVLEEKKNVTLKTSSRRFQDVFNTSWPKRMFTARLQRCLQYLYV